MSGKSVNILRWGWLLSLLVLDACQWNLDSRVFPKCETPTAQIKSTANMLDVSFALDKMTGTTDNVDWDFGNGDKRPGTPDAPTQYKYTNPGTYTVTATLTNQCSHTATSSKVLTVSDVVLPTAQTEDATDVTATGATFRMKVTDNGRGEILKYGFYYSSAETLPTDKNAEGTVESKTNPAVNAVNALAVSILKPNTTYYVRAFAENSAGTSVSELVKSFTTKPQPPVVSTVGTSFKDGNNALVQFQLDYAGVPAGVRYGVCYSATTGTPGLPDSKTVDVLNPTVGEITYVRLTDLDPNTVYYYCSFAMYREGSETRTVYGKYFQFKTTDINLTTGLVANLLFDGNLNDISGYGNGALGFGQPTFTVNRFGTDNAALKFDGTNDYIELANTNSLRFATAFSISCWIRPTTRAQQSRMQVFMKNQFSTGENEQYSALIKPVTTGSSAIKPQINFDVKQGSNCVVGKGWQSLEQADIVQADVWHHIVFVYEGTSMKFYYDGVLVQTKAGLSQGFIDNCDTGELKFGVQSTGEFANYFQGAMDDIRIYNKALTDRQVGALFAQ